MIELIVVCIVIGLLVTGWFAACIDAQGVKEGVKIALGVPVMIVILVSVVVYIFHSFSVVFS